MAIGTDDSSCFGDNYMGSCEEKNTLRIMGLTLFL